MKRYFTKLLFVLTFALLQCVAPLVHAHVDGHQTGILPPSFTAQYHADQQSINSSCSIEETESAAITIPHEFQRDSHISIAQATHPNQFNLAKLSEVRHLTVASPAIFILSHYNKSHPQAPPALG